MSYNGSGTFNINSAGQPVVTGTVITSTAFNALTADLATGLSTALTKDGQTTPTANIPMGTYKITGLGAGTVATDAVRLSQLQNGGTTTYITAAGTDTITGTVTPALTAYATGQQFSFVVAATNTTAVTLNVDGVGAKAVTRTGSVALVAGDMIIGQVVIVEYDGTRFQLINGNNLRVAGTTSGIATIVTPAAAGTPTLTLPVVTGTLATLAGTETLTNKTLTAPVLSGTATGTYTLAGTPTITSPTITGASITVAASAAPAFSAYQSTSTAVTPSTSTKVLFDVELFDTNSNFASSRFTPTVEGYYQVNARTGLSSSVLTRGQASIRKNGVAVNTLEDTNGSAAYSSIGSALIYMNGSTDYLEIYVFIAGTTTVYDGGAALTWFQAAMARSA